MRTKEIVKIAMIDKIAEIEKQKLTTETRRRTKAKAKAFCRRFAQMNADQTRAYSPRRHGEKRKAILTADKR